MSNTTPDDQDAAREAAQRVADSAESWEHASEESMVREHLEQGFDEAGVEVTEDEEDKLVDQIKDDDAQPVVDGAVPEDR
jgi:hypothetical protein